MATMSGEAGVKRNLLIMSRLNLLKLPFFVAGAFDSMRGRARSIYYRSITTIPPNSRYYDTAKVVNLRNLKSEITIGSNSHIRGELITFAHAGSIRIGDHCYIGESSRIWSASEITIGNRVLVSHNVNIHDCDGHPIDAVARHGHFVEIVTKGHPKELNVPSSPVVVGDDVWIGFNTTILKGVTIGRGAIIGAGSVVTSNVPDLAIFAGNPAKFIREVN